MAMNEEVALGQVVQNARKQAGLTQQELCEKASISYSTLAKIERGAIRSPSVFTIRKLAECLNVSLDELMGHTGGGGSFQVKTPNGRSKSGITFVYFDINGCLVRFFHRAFTQLAHDTGMPADRIEQTFWHYNDAVCRGEMTLEDFNNVLREQLHKPDINWTDYYIKGVDPITEMHELATWVAGHYRMGLLSNIMPGFIGALLQNNLIPNLPYTTVVDSSKVGAIKPEAKIYEEAMARAGVPASEILLVDDSRTNIMAAEKMGWHVLWFDDYQPLESTDRIRSTLELAESANPTETQATAQPPTPPPAQTYTANF